LYGHVNQVGGKDKVVGRVHCGHLLIDGVGQPPLSHVAVDRICHIPETIPSASDDIVSIGSHLTSWSPRVILFWVGGRPLYDLVEIGFVLPGVVSVAPTTRISVEKQSWLTISRRLFSKKLNWVTYLLKNTFNDILYNNYPI
jgi:hypothetical protein